MAVHNLFVGLHMFLGEDTSLWAVIIIGINTNHEIKTCYESSVSPAGHLVVLGVKLSDTKTQKQKAEHVIYPWNAEILVIRTMQPIFKIQ